MSETVQNIVENNDPAFPVVSQGYAPDEVERFVNEAQNLVARLLEENAELRSELKAKTPRQALAAESATLLVHAQQVADEFISKAQEQAAATIADADEYSDTVTGEADANAERIVSDAENRAAQLKEEIESLTENRDNIIRRALAFHNQETERLNAYLNG